MNDKSLSSENVKQNDVNEEFTEKLNEYYKLKNKYEHKKQSQINTILKDDKLSMKQKQEKYRKLKTNCINCGRNVGTIFNNESGNLTAICGDKISSCSLNIKIYRGNFTSLEELIDVFQTGVDDVKEEIITTKLDLLFGYEQEPTTLTKFTKLKDELTQDLEAVMEYKTQFIEIVSNLDNKSELNTKMTIFYNKIALIKSTIDEFNETGQIQLIKDMISTYQTELVPLLHELRELKYRYMAMEYDRDTDTHTLVRNVFTLQDMNISIESPSIKSFVIGNTSEEDRSRNMINATNDESYDGDY
tara:strand:- start:3633 stop:4538 length:906 start_codon:yes stop_codon:yes gene_type:complete